MEETKNQVDRGAKHRRKRVAVHFFLYEEEREKLDELVKLGMFKNRYELLKEMINEFYTKYSEGQK